MSKQKLDNGDKELIDPIRFHDEKTDSIRACVDETPHKYAGIQDVYAKTVVDSIQYKP